MPAWVLSPVVLVVEGLEWLFARAAGVVSLLILAAVGHGAWKVAPPYAAHYRLQDRVAEVVRMHNAHSPVPGDTPELRGGLMQAVREQRLEAYIRDGDFRVESTGSMVRVSCHYRVAVEILPGRKHTLHFHLDVAEPVMERHETRFI